MEIISGGGRVRATVREHPKLLAALAGFARRGGNVEITFGANTFSGEEGSDYDAIKTLLDELSEFPNARVCLYNELARTFHPKFYLFASERAALLIVGSSNWSHGGLENNVEANVLLHLDFSDGKQKAAYDDAMAVLKPTGRASIEEGARLGASCNAGEPSGLRALASAD